jgi:hypothetical protein
MYPKYCSQFREHRPLGMRFGGDAKNNLPGWAFSARTIPGSAVRPLAAHRRRDWYERVFNRALAMRVATHVAPTLRRAPEALRVMDLLFGLRRG